METYSCKRCKRTNLTAEEMDTGREGRPNKSTCRKSRTTPGNAWKKATPGALLADCARHRAKIKGLPFDLTRHDITVPKFCPVLGIELEKGKGRLHDASPTLDRLVPEKGYTKDNVVVVSYKANRMKSNATLSELKRLVAWMEK